MGSTGHERTTLMPRLPEARTLDGASPAVYIARCQRSNIPTVRRNCCISVKRFISGKLPSMLYSKNIFAIFCRMAMTTNDSFLPALAEAGRFHAGPVDVRTERILRIQGYRVMGRVRRPIRRAAESAAEIAREVADGEVGYRRVAIAACCGSTLELECGERFQCGAFERFLVECESVVVFAMTAGAAIDRRIDELMAADEPVVALMLDTAGWLAVESVTRQFSERLKADCEPAGLRLTRRMGPGYTYRMGREMAPWGLEEQEGLFRVLGEDASPVTVFDSGAMLPKMSRSGLYGLRAAGSAQSVV